MEQDFSNDTRKLLRECDAGIKMGIASLDDVMSEVTSPELQQRLKDSKREHEKLRADTEKQLCNIKDAGKSPNPAAKAMSHMKTKMAVAVNGCDSTAARLVTKGCDMGIKSLNRYLDKYGAADKRSVDLTREIIAAEQSLRADLEKYL